MAVRRAVATAHPPMADRAVCRAMVDLIPLRVGAEEVDRIALLAEAVDVPTEAAVVVTPPVVVAIRAAEVEDTPVEGAVSLRS